MKDTTPRKTARLNGHVRYDGLPCVKCNRVVRYTGNGECVYCRNVTNCARERTKRETRGLMKRGRPRKHLESMEIIEKRAYERYDKTTDFGNWVWRSKHGNNSKARKELKVEDYKNIMRTHCPLLGVKLSYKVYEGKVCPSNYATLDKIDPSKGYVSGNIQILSYRANTLKNSATLEELKTIIKNWENLIG